MARTKQTARRRTYLPSSPPSSPLPPSAAEAAHADDLRAQADHLAETPLVVEDIGRALALHSDLVKMRNGERPSPEAGMRLASELLTLVGEKLGPVSTRECTMKQMDLYLMKCLDARGFSVVSMVEEEKKKAKKEEVMRGGYMETMQMWLDGEEEEDVAEVKQMIHLNEAENEDDDDEDLRRGHLEIYKTWEEEDARLKQNASAATARSAKVLHLRKMAEMLNDRAEADAVEVAIDDEATRSSLKRRREDDKKKNKKKKKRKDDAAVSVDCETEPKKCKSVPQSAPVPVPSPSSTKTVPIVAWRKRDTARNKRNNKRG